MRNYASCTNNIVLLLLSAIPSLSLGQTTHVVQVGDDFFQPADITIQAGDTVRWENPSGGAFHNVVSDTGVFSSGTPATFFNFEFTFTEGGEYPYHCVPHRPFGMTGSVTVEGSVEPPIAFNPGHNGNWWNGLPRAGEGAQIEVASADGGELVFVVTVYSYGPTGGQIFLIGVGTPEGDTVNVDVFITDGGVWGEGFDPEDIDETQWGTGTFTAQSCELINMSLTPNVEYQALGFTDLAYDLARLTTPAIPCPYED